MKAYLAILLISFCSIEAMADEVKIVSCTEEIEELTLSDMTAMIRNKSGFETGELSILKKDSGAYQNSVMLKNFNEEKDEVTYIATIVGDVTNKSNNKTVFSIDQCEVRFDASTCEVKTQLCSGI